MSDLIQEVADDMKSEKFFMVIKKFTKVFLVVAALILLATAGVVYWKHKHEQKQLVFSVDFYEFLGNSGDYNLVKQLNNADSEAFGPMADLHYAKSLLAQHKYKEGVKSLTEVIKNENNDIVFRNLAKLMMMSTVLNQDLKDVASEKISIDSKTNQPFEDIIKMFYAQILFRDKHEAEAKQILSELVASNDTFDNIKFLANVLIG